MILQPSDETPLPSVGLPASLQSSYPSATVAKDAIHASSQQMDDTVRSLVAQTAGAQATTMADLHQAIATAVNSSHAAMDMHMSGLAKAVGQLAKKSDKAMSATEDAALAAGIQIPLSHPLRQAVLADESGGLLLGEFADALTAAGPTGPVAGNPIIAGPGDGLIGDPTGQPVLGKPIVTTSPPITDPVVTVPIPAPVAPVAPVIGWIVPDPGTCCAAVGGLYYSGDGRCYVPGVGGVTLPTVSGHWVETGCPPIAVANPITTIPPTGTTYPVTSPPGSPPTSYPPSTPTVPTVPVTSTPGSSPPPPATFPPIELGTVPVTPPPPPEAEPVPPVPPSPPPPSCPPAVTNVTCAPAVYLSCPPPYASPPTPVPPPPSPPGMPLPPPVVPPPPATSPPATSPPPATVPPATISPPVTPPAPPVPPVPPSVTPASGVVTWSAANACQMASGLAGMTLGQTLGTVAPPSGGLISLLSAIVDPITSIVWPEAVPDDPAYNDWNVGRAALNAAIGRVLPIAIPDPLSAATYLTQLGVLGMAEANLHIPLQYVGQWITYTLQYTNPMFIPSQGDIDRQYLFNQISWDTWTCLTRANGNIPTLYAPNVSASTAQPNIGEIIDLRRRGIIPDDATFKQRMRSVGVLNASNSDEFYALSSVLPTQSDLITMMVRDAADDTVAATYGYDFEFSDKFTGQVATWANQIGADPLLFKYLWRSHWKIPSNTQLYDMLHRLRPDRSEVTAWDTAYPPDYQPGDGEVVPPRPPVVEVSDVQTALEVNDVAPYWVDKLIATSYQPLTNTDARRMFDLGIIDNAEFIQRTQDNGYTLEDATTLVGYFAAEKAKLIANSTGVMTARKIISLYKEGAYTHAQALSNLGDVLPSQTDRLHLLSNADLESQAEARALCLKSLKRQWMQGYINPVALAASIAQLGPDQNAAQLIANRWICERGLRSKEVPAAKLCALFNHKLITAEVYVTRLVNLGYTDADAHALASVCYEDALAKNIKSQIAFLRQQITEQRYEQKNNGADWSNAIKLELQQIKQLQAQLAAVPGIQI